MATTSTKKEVAANSRNPSPKKNGTATTTKTINESPTRKRPTIAQTQVPVQKSQAPTTTTIIEKERMRKEIYAMNRVMKTIENSKWKMLDSNHSFGV